ncbi:MAG: hypothetical protein HUJ30_08630 [Gammaproteobacteria bacterium]|nr:hypothetical protein [Gammaproteobacteria bacterium]
MNKYLGIILSSLLLVTMPAVAQPVEEEPALEQLDWYDIEVVIFRHHDLPALSRELWQRDPGNPDLRDAQKLLPALPEVLSEAHTDQLQALAFVMLQADSMQLTEKFELLREASAYDPLIHVAWRQPGYGPEHAVPVHIHGGINWSATPRETELEGAIDSESGAPTSLSIEELQPVITSLGDEFIGPPAPFIDGTIKVIRKRFLHVETDLLYRAPYLDDEKNTLKREEWPQAFRLQESRRMRSKEIHYLDHPMFGMLVLATPYKFEEMTDEAGEIAVEPKPATTTNIPAISNNPLTGSIRR